VTARGRFAAAAAAVLLGTAGATGGFPAAVAQEPEQPAPRPAITTEEDPAWGGSRLGDPLDTGSHIADVGEIAVAGRFRFARGAEMRVAVTVEPTVALAAGCAPEQPPEVAADAQPSEQLRGDYTFRTPAVRLACNGRYLVTATARAHRTGGDQGAGPAATSPDLVAHLAVAAPPPDVTGLRLTPGSDQVRLGWDRSAAAPPDLLGYRIDRATGGGEHRTLATVGPQSESWIDEAPPGGGAELGYRVVAVRPGPDGPDAGLVTSLAAAEATTALQDPSDADTGPGPRDAERPEGSALDRFLSRDRTPALAAPRAPSRLPAPLAERAPGGSQGPPRAARAGGASLDAGYDDELPYDPEPGEPDAVEPPGAAAFQNAGDRPDGAAILTPVAAALVMAVWAAHFRYFARLGRPRG
jgi:hypothetical protein